MTIMVLTPEKIFSIIESEENFPVDFDDAWRWIGYSSKQKALKALSSNLVEKIDFLTIGLKSSTGGRQSVHIALTVDGFKMFCIMAGTDKGREVRLYFLKCEKELKRRIKEEREISEASKQKTLVAAMVSEEVVSRKSRFTNAFYEMLYKKRGQGWESKDPAKYRPSCVGIWTNKVVYERLLGGTQPGSVKETLNKVNPRRENGTRKNRHHWHFKELGAYHLETHMYALTALANTVPDGDWDKFMYRVEQAFPNNKHLQLALWDIFEQMNESEFLPSSVK